MAFFLSLEGIHRHDLDTGAKLFAALGQTVLMHGARPTRHQVQQPFRGMILPSRQVHDAGEFTGALVGVGPGDATRLSSTPSTRTPAKNGQGHQMRLADTA